MFSMQRCCFHDAMQGRKQCYPGRGYYSFGAGSEITVLCLARARSKAKLSCVAARTFNGGGNPINNPRSRMNGVAIGNMQAGQVVEFSHRSLDFLMAGTGSFTALISHMKPVTGLGIRVHDDRANSYNYAHLCWAGYQIGADPENENWGLIFRSSTSDPKPLSSFPPSNPTLDPPLISNQLQMTTG
jgi:hypothetical protein